MSDEQLAEALIAALHRIADSMHANAEATAMLARATAGDLEDDVPQGEQYLDR